MLGAKSFTAALLAYFTLSLSVLAQAAAPIDVVFDLDWTILYKVDESHQLIDPRNVVRFGWRTYRLSDHSLETLAALHQMEGVRVSFFSAGSADRNQEVLRQIYAEIDKMTGTQGRYRPYRVGSSNLVDKIPMPDDPTETFNKKDLSKLIPDFNPERTVLIDDNYGHAFSGQERNLLYFESFQDVPDFNQWQKAMREQPDQLLDSALKWPVSRRRWALERNKMAYALEVIREAKLKSDHGPKTFTQVVSELSENAARYKNGNDTPLVEQLTKKGLASLGLPPDPFIRHNLKWMTLPPEWERHKKMIMTFAAETLELFPEDEIYYLARDMDPVYEGLKTLLRNYPDQLERLHLINVSRANLNDPLLPKYLEQEGLSAKALHGRRAVFIDTGFEGTIPKAIKQALPKDLSEQQIYTHMLSSLNPNISSSRAALNAYRVSPKEVQRDSYRDSVTGFEHDLPKSRNRSDAFTIQNGKVAPTSSVPIPKEAAQMNQFAIEDLKRTFESSAGKAQFNRMRKSFKAIVDAAKSGTLSADNPSVKNALLELQKLGITEFGSDLTDAYSRGGLPAINNLPPITAWESPIVHKPLSKLVSYQEFEKVLQTYLSRIPELQDLWAWSAKTGNQVEVGGGILRGLMKLIQARLQIHRLDEVLRMEIPAVDQMVAEGADLDLFASPRVKALIQKELPQYSDWDILRSSLFEEYLAMGGPTLEKISASPTRLVNTAGGFTDFYNGRLVFKEPKLTALKDLTTLKIRGHLLTGEALRFIRLQKENPQLRVASSDLASIRKIAAAEMNQTFPKKLTNTIMSKRLYKLYQAHGHDVPDTMAALKRASLLDFMAKHEFKLYILQDYTEKKTFQMVDYIAQLRREGFDTHDLVQVSKVFGDAHATERVNYLKRLAADAKSIDEILEITDPTLKMNIILREGVTEMIAENADRISTLHPTSEQVAVLVKRLKSNYGSSRSAAKKLLQGLDLTQHAKLKAAYHDAGFSEIWKQAKSPVPLRCVDSLLDSVVRATIQH